MNFREMTVEQLREESLIDLAYAILDDRKSAMNFKDLVAEVQNLIGLTDDEMKARLVQFYTDLNVEGRFLLNQENGWGLREWYKVETVEEETAPTVKARKKKKVTEDLDEEELLELDEDEIVFEEDYDEFVDKEEEEILVDEDEIELLEDDIEELDADIEDELIVSDDDDFDIEDEEEIEE